VIVTHYRTDRNHSEFLLFDVLGVADAYGRAPFEDVDVDAARDVLEQAERFATERLAPSFVVGDRCPPVLDPVTHEVALPGEVATALREHLASDWLGLDLPPGRCEVRVPASLRWAATEFAMGANPAVGMCTQLVPQVVRLLDTAGTPAQRRLAELILERQWTVTMVLTEPDAGSDVGAARTRAFPQPDGTWHLEGTKHFITWGEHDATDNIVHLVLARPVGVEGAGGPGSRGLSLFVVPSHHYDPDTGEVGRRNGVMATGLEHKMGVRATPTVGLTFGDGEPAVGTLLGDEHRGLRQMFEIITYVRLLVGLKSAAALSTGYLGALEQARTRVQGRPLITFDSAGPEPVPIVEHPDVRRSLMSQRAFAEGARALVLYTATLFDRMEVAEASGIPDDVAVVRHRLLLPVVKTWCAETAWQVLGSECLQVFGGSGFLEDHPLEQYVRDTKIDSIYEGTSGIQSMDLLQRRVAADRGKALGELLAEVTALADSLADSGALQVEAGLLRDSADDVTRMAGLSLDRAHSDPQVAALGARALLLAVGDVVVGWLLLRSAVVADERCAAAGEPADGDLAGRAAAARWYARQVLPRTSAALRSLRLLDSEVMDLPAGRR
jgi:alkylation response protein AidB-like acyl-CoA dehydrogenase